MKMPFLPKNNANPNGRPKGSKTRRPVQDRIANLIEWNMESIEKQINVSTPEVRREFFMKLVDILRSPDQNVLIHN